MVKASVIIPAFNRKRLLQLSLLSFNLQDCPSDWFEVIVVDDGSTDGTVEMIESLDLHYPLQVFRTVSNRGAAAARNLGIAHAQGELIIFSDSDLLVPANFISGHLKYHRNDLNLAVCCVFRWKKIFSYYFSGFNSMQNDEFTILRQNRPVFEQRLVEIAFDYEDEQQILTAEDLPGFEEFSYIPPWSEGYLGAIVTEYGTDVTEFAFPWVLFGTGNSSVRKIHLEAVRGFDVQMRREEDWELGYRLFKHGLHFTATAEMEGAHQEHPIIAERREHMMQAYELFFAKHPEPLVWCMVLHLENVFDWLTLSKAIREYQILTANESVYKPVIDRFHSLLRMRTNQFLLSQKIQDEFVDLQEEWSILNPVQAEFPAFVKVFRELARKCGDS